MSLVIAGTMQGKVYEEQLLRKDSVVNEFVCKICLVHVVGSNPKLTKCSHLFCGDCLDQWIASNPSNLTWAQRARSCGEVPCPACKAPLQKNTDVVPVEKGGRAISDLLWRMIQALEIKCAHPDCQWTGTYGEYWDHLACDSCGLGDFAAPEVEVKLLSSPGSTTGSPASSPAELTADEIEDFEDVQLPEAELGPEQSLPSPPESSSEDLNSLIRELLELEQTHELGVPSQSSSKEGEEAQETPNASPELVRTSPVAPKKQKKTKQTGATRSHAEDKPAFQAPSQFQVLQAAQAQQLQAQAFQWRLQQMHWSKQWQAYANQSPQHRMAAAAQSQMLYMQQMARYQQLAYYARNRAC